ADDEQADDERRQAASELAPAREEQNFGIFAVVVGRHGLMSAAEAESRKRVACGCRRRIVAGQAVEIGSWRVARTGSALRASGTIASTRRAASSAGIVTVIACVGTSSIVAK